MQIYSQIVFGSSPVCAEFGLSWLLMALSDVCDYAYGRCDLVRTLDALEQHLVPSLFLPETMQGSDNYEGVITTATRTP